MRLLHVNSSARYEGSVSRELAAFFVAQLRLHHSKFDVEYLDISENPPPHVNELQVEAHATPPDKQTREMREAIRRSDVLIDQLLSVDACLFAMPMYNFSVPSVFKAYIDNIVRLGRTFEMSGDKAVGLFTGRPLLFITTRGCDYQVSPTKLAKDLLEPQLRLTFEFIGATELTFVNAQPLVNCSAERREEAIAQARVALDSIAQAWAKKYSRPSRTAQMI